MATTTNYGWTTPDDTALVKDGAAAIRTLGSSIDTTTKALNPETTLGDISYRSSTANVNTRLPLGTAGQVLKVNSGATAPEWSSDNAGMTNPMTTTGDTIYSSSGSTPARLGIGTTGQVLTVAAGVPSWAAAPSSTQNWSLINAGGTSMASTASITVSGITGADKLMVVILSGRNSAGVSYKVKININGDTASNYNHSGLLMKPAGSYGYSIWDFFSNGNGADSNGICVGDFSGSASSYISSTTFINGGNSAGLKTFQTQSGVVNGNTTNSQNVIAGGWYSGTSTISSIVVTNNDGSTNFTSGTLYVFKSA